MFLAGAGQNRELMIMSNQASPHRPPASASTAMIITLGLVAMLSGLLVVTVFQITRPIIAENQRRATERAVLKVVPGAVVHREFILAKDGIFAPESGREGVRIYAGYDKKGKLAGIAANAGAQGYADMIYILYGYDPDCQCIRGIKVLKMAETPGLGDRITTDAAFLKNFEALDASLAPDGSALANAIVTVKHGAKQHDWQIDAISGATISSRAIGKALNSSAQKLLPLLQRHLESLKSQTPPKVQP